MSGEVRVYPGKLQTTENFCTVTVTDSSTVKELVKEALVQFGLKDFDPDDYQCSEILLDRGG